MKAVAIKLKNIKNIKSGTIEIPVEKGIFCIAGENGSGKSTLMSCLAKLVYSRSLEVFHSEDVNNDSEICIEYENRKNTWRYDVNKTCFIKQETKSADIRFKGMYEGSLFYGTRFNDSLIIDELVKEKKIAPDDIVDSDQYIKEKLSYILHGNYNHYQKLKRVRNKNIARRLGLKNTPYFHEFAGGLVSQYRMSSGECLLISLLHFIYNSIERRSLPPDAPIIVLIDEIELALHPSAVSRLLDLLESLLKEHNNLTIILSSHSPELIRKIEPDKMFVAELTITNCLNIVNPCYPSYAIRDIYMHIGFDYIILVEDILAQLLVEKMLEKLNLRKSCLINVLPVGGWENVLRFQEHIKNDNSFGSGTAVFSVLDGDVEGEVLRNTAYKNYKKSFLPIGSVEKYLKNILIDRKNDIIRKDINDQFFSVESVDSIVADFYKEYKNSDSSGKKLYGMLRDNLEGRKITQDVFVRGLTDIVLKHEDCTKLEKFLKSTISCCCD